MLARVLKCTAFLLKVLLLISISSQRDSHRMACLLLEIEAIWIISIAHASSMVGSVLLTRKLLVSLLDLGSFSARILHTLIERSVEFARIVMTHGDQILP